MEEVLGQRLLSQAGYTSTTAAKSHEFVLLYFSASWCPPCRLFTPKLLSFYNDVNQSRQLLEVVLVSRDREESGFHAYYTDMPWLAIPFSSSDRLQSLVDTFQVDAIPKLVLLDSDGNSAFDDCKRDVETLGPAAIRKWRDYL